jgi:hypothetical protein
VARRTLRWSGVGGAAKVASLVRVLVGAIVCFCGSAALIVGSQADGGSGQTASPLLRIGIVGMILTVVITAVVAARLAGRWGASCPEVVAGLGAWAARHGWEVTTDAGLAAHWAKRFHFSAGDLTTPRVAARGWVHGRDAMILFCELGTEKNPDPQTIVVVDADADYPVTAVVRPRSASALFHAYGDAVPLESVEFERRWRAMGRDAAGSHAVFTPRVIERLLEPTPGSQPVIVWDGPGIRAADDAFIADPMHLESRLLLLADLAGLTPAYQVTRTNDDPSLLPYVPPPALKVPVVALVLIWLGTLVWVAGAMVAPAENGMWVVVVSTIVGLTLVLPGALLGRLGQARRVREWHAAQSAALAPPGGAKAPPRA